MFFVFPSTPKERLYSAFYISLQFFLWTESCLCLRWNIESLEKTERKKYVCEKSLSRASSKNRMMSDNREIHDPKTIRLFIARRTDVYSRCMYMWRRYIRSSFCVGKTFMSPDYCQREIGLCDPESHACFWSTTLRRAFFPKEIYARCYGDKTSTSWFQKESLASCFLFYDESITPFAITLMIVNQIKVNGIK